MARMVAVVVLVGVAVLAVWDVRPPVPRGVDAPATEFSAERAMADLGRVAGKPHVAGSAANDEVRGHLVARLRQLGLETQVQDAIGMDPTPAALPAMARVRNVVAVLPGSAPTGRIFLVAHHDSIQVGPGGSDDGAGTAAILETARALAEGPQLRNDVVVVLTDAEEACLCGAEAFVGQHPLAADGGIVLNLEARGTGGPVVMFETSPRNARLVEVFGRVAPHPVATSFAVEVYRILPNDTDFSAFTAAAGRFAGLNSAYIDGSAAYHTPQDTAQRLSRASLQAHGDNALALTRAFGEADLDDLAAETDATYFPVPWLLVRYPGSLVWPVAVLALLAVVVLAWLARRRGRLSWPRAAVGVVLALVPVLLAPAAAQAYWLLLVALRPGYAGMADPWNPTWFRLTVLALVGTVLFAWYGLLRRLVGASGLVVGALVQLAIVGLLLAYAAPGGSYLAALPALTGALAGMAAVGLRRPAAQLAVLTVGAAVAVLVLGPSVLLFFPALGLETGGAAALFAVLLGLALLPALDVPRPAVVSATCALAAVALTLVGLAIAPLDAEHPAPAQLMYALDAGSGEARWVSTEADPGPWTAGYVEGREDVLDDFPVLDDEGEPLATGPAPVANLPAADLRTLSDTTQGERRTLRLMMVPRRAVRLMALQVRGASRVVEATIAGRAVPVGREDFGVQFHAPPSGGVEVTLVLVAAGDTNIGDTNIGDTVVRVMDGSDGLDRLPGFEPRPTGVGIAGSHTSELVVTARDYRLSR